ncbi:MAG TPA: deoxynucleoside kinase [bacterium]|nr:deoxynucleoside kinase [bacterium]
MSTPVTFRPPRASQSLLPGADGIRPAGVHVAVEGPIGVGKTTLARVLAGELGAEPVLEVVEENPFLLKFYEDIRAYAFQTQIFFFLSRHRQQQAIKAKRQAGASVVSDYIFPKDRLFARMNLDDRELDLYDRLFEIVAPTTVAPDLVIYLQAGVDTLLRRIAHRDRSFERAIERDYLARLCEVYEDFMPSYDEVAVLTVDTDKVDIFARPDLDEILGFVREVAPA